MRKETPSPTTVESAPVAPRETGGVTIIREEIPQSTVAFGHAGILREDPDYTAAYVLMHILGSGGFTGRLMKEVREKNGLAYGVSASLAPQDRGGLITGYVASGNDRVAQAVALIREEWRKMAEEGPSDEEIAAAKKYLTGAFALRFDSNAKIARFLVGAQRSKLGLDYIDRRNGEVEAITADDLRRVAKRILKPDALYFAIVGDPSGLDATE